MNARRSREIMGDKRTGSGKRTYTKKYVCDDCKKTIFLKSRWFKCPECGSVRITKYEYDHDQGE